MYSVSCIPHITSCDLHTELMRWVLLSYFTAKKISQSQRTNQSLSRDPKLTGLSWNLLISCLCCLPLLRPLSTKYIIRHESYKNGWCFLYTRSWKMWQSHLSFASNLPCDFKQVIYFLCDSVSIRVEWKFYLSPPMSRYFNGWFDKMIVHYEKCYINMDIGMIVFTKCRNLSSCLTDWRGLSLYTLSPIIFMPSCASRQ